MQSELYVDSLMSYNNYHFSKSIMTVGQPVNRRHDNDEDSGESPAPPDGGWGWMVVFGSFMIHVISKYS